MVFWAGLMGAAIGSAVGVTLRRRGQRHAQLFAAATAAGVFLVVASDALGS